MAANAPSNETEAEPGALEMVSSASDKVSEGIIRGIRSGAFVPGQHLVEPDLTRRPKPSHGQQQ